MSIVPVVGIWLFIGMGVFSGCSHTPPLEPSASTPKEPKLTKLPEIPEVLPEAISSPATQERIREVVRETLKDISIPSPLEQPIPVPLKLAELPEDPAVLPTRKSVEPAWTKEQLRATVMKALEKVEIPSPLADQDPLDVASLPPSTALALSVYSELKVIPERNEALALQGKEAPGPMETTETKEVLAAYASRVKIVIDRNWHWQGDTDLELSVVLSFRIYPDGRATRVAIAETSGNQVFDRAAIRAVRQLERLPRFPSDIHKEFLDVGMSFTKERDPNASPPDLPKPSVESASGKVLDSTLPPPTPQAPQVPPSVSAEARASDYQDGKDAYDRKDYATAFKLFMKAASQMASLDSWLERARPINSDKSDEELTLFWQTIYGLEHATLAPFYLGGMYAEGKGVPQDDAQAVHWYTKAAEAGDMSAQLNLSRMYSTGRGVPQDDVQAAHWFGKVRNAAEAGDTDAQRALGSMYEREQDYREAARWYTKAAEAGDEVAALHLSFMYAKGRGVAQDDAQAAHWSRIYDEKEAAREAKHEAVYALLDAFRYYDEQDYQQAVRWYRKAAEAGNTDAQFYLGLMYDKGEGVPQDYHQAVRWYRKAAEAGDTDAQLNLGVMYGKGEGVPQDYVKAHRWYNIAAANTTDKETRDLAVSNRDIVARKMSTHQVAEAQKLAREWKPTTGTPPDRQQEIARGEAATSGTGFVVSRQGHVLTNHHVIDGCTTVRATTEGRRKSLTVVGTDAENDLALLTLPTPAPSVARFRERRPIRPGDGVVVVGFPLHGLLASEPNVTTGAVSALAGIGNDTRFLQITAPVQPGNSGGPLLDQSGHIVGVVVSRMDAIETWIGTGNTPQNINFAIKGAVATSFLDSQSVEYEVGASSKTMGSAKIGAAARKFTLLLECYR